MTRPLAVQLYSLRTSEDAWVPELDRGRLQDLAETGYLGVETVDVPGGDPVAARRTLEELGLTLTSSHTWSSPADPEARHRAFAAIAEMGAPRVSVYGGQLASLADVDRAADRINTEARIAARLGMTVSLHNEIPEGRLLDGVRAYDLLKERLDPSVCFQVDIFWATAAGVSPRQMIRDLGERVVSLHVKDAQVIAPGVGDGLGAPFVNVPVGDGIVDVTGAIAASDELPGVEWLIVEFDYVEGDMLDAIKRSYRNLTTRGLARGSR